MADLKGIGKQMPVTMWCFMIASLSLVGIPPMGGFTSKWVIGGSRASESGMGSFHPSAGGSADLGSSDGGISVPGRGWMLSSREKILKIRAGERREPML